MQIPAISIILYNSGSLWYGLIILNWKQPDKHKLMIILEYSVAFGVNTYFACSLWKSQLLQKTDKTPNEQTTLCFPFFPGNIMNIKPQHSVNAAPRRQSLL